MKENAQLRLSHVLVVIHVLAICLYLKMCREQDMSIILLGRCLNTVKTLNGKKAMTISQPIQSTIRKRKFLRTETT